MKKLTKKTVLFLLVIVMVFASLSTGLVGIINVSAEETKIDNSSLLPAYKPDSEVVLDEKGHPDWMADLIMTQFRIETVTEEGTFQSAVKALDHCAETGINGIWINPIYEREAGVVEESNNGYGNMGPATVEPTLTGKDNLEESYEVIKEFIDEAHKRNIRVIFDIVVWGTAKTSPLVTDHPEFYEKPMREAWGGWVWDWNSRELRDYMTDATVNFILKTGADGFRVDLAPDSSGYYFKEVKEALLEKGRKVMIMSEGTSEHLGAFDIDQSSVGWGVEDMPWHDPDALQALRDKYGHHGEAFVKEGNNIVESVKTGNLVGHNKMQLNGLGSTFKYYTFNLLNHDDGFPIVKGNRVKIGYQAIFSPFIPTWFIGEEWNNPKKEVWPGYVMFFNYIDWSKKEDPRRQEFYEDVKKFIQIRRMNPDIFRYFPERLRDTNIEKVDSEIVGVGDNTLQTYARYTDKQAFIIAPNYTKQDANMKITPNYDIIGLSKATSLKVTDMLTDKVIFEGTRAELASFNVDIKSYYVGVLKIDATEIDESLTTANPDATGNATGGATTTGSQQDETSKGIDSTILIIAVAGIVVVIVGAAIVFALKNKKK